jgi:hypothetical protein
VGRRLLGPAYDPQPAVEVFHQCRAAFDPIAVVAIENAVDGADLCMMDVAAHDAVDAAPAGLCRDGHLVVGDELHGVLNLVLEIGRERPVGQAEPATHRVEDGVQTKREVVGPVTEDGEPARVAHDAVELVAMDHQQLPAVGRQVDRLRFDTDVTEGELAVLTRRLVVIARDIDDVGALARLAQHFLHDVVVRLGPVPPAPQTPAIDDVAHEVEVFALVFLQEVEQHLGLATARAEMDIGNEDGAMVHRGLTFDHGHVDNDSTDTKSVVRNGAARCQLCSAAVARS